MNHLHPQFIYTAQLIQRILEKYYNLKFPLAASEYLISQETAKITLKNKERAGVIIQEDQQNDYFNLGIFFSEQIIENILEINPILHICNANLDGLWVLTEEISHFCLICSKVANNSQVSSLELEWQAEIDKIIVSAILLKSQSGNSHIIPLIHKSFSECEILKDQKTYEEANFYAGRFWYTSIKKGLGTKFDITEKCFKKVAIANYGCPINAKTYLK